MASKVILKHRIRRESSSDNSCTLCYHETKVWVVSPCDHFMCLKCSCRLRVLCDMKECPVCREKNDKVVVVEKRQPFSSLSFSKMIKGHRNGFFFENRRLIESFEALKTVHCIKCDENEEEDTPTSLVRFSNMKHLQDHLRREHRLYMCEICVEHLKLFPHEHKLYTREQLARHRREGDPDDSAHKGHPLCQFCEERFLDTDTLFFHLKNKHFWCHFCEADGKQDYYADYSELRVHFRQAHYLCSEGPCHYEKFTSVFRTKLDFQAHKARDHSKGLTKAEAKQLRHVDVGFVYSREDALNDGMPHISQRQYGGASSSNNNSRKKQALREGEDIEGPTVLPIEKTKDSHSNNSHSSDGTSSEESTPDPLPSQSTINPLSNHDTTTATISITTTTTKTTHIKTSTDSSSLLSSQTEQWPSLLTNDSDTNPTTTPLILPPPGFSTNSELSSATKVTTTKDTSSAKRDTSSAKRDTSSAKRQYNDTSSASSKRPIESNTRVSPKDIPTKVPPITRSVEEDKGDKSNEIFEIALALLDNNKKKISLFRNCSGLYQRSEISVDDYYQQCSSLFGSSWNSIGLHIASTLPDPIKRNELHSKFTSYQKWPPPAGLAQPPPGLTKPPPGLSHLNPALPPPGLASNKKNKKSKGKSQQQTNSSKPWDTVRPVNKASLNDDEFPSLQKASTMPDPVTAPPKWNQKVTTIVK